MVEPIERRRRDLLSDNGGVIAHIHLRAQKLLLQTYTLGFGSTGVAWVAAITDYVSAETAVGLGGLGVAVGLRWCVSRWEKSKKKFWKDWSIVREGLSRDLSVC
jgi:hypothetical protein